MFSAQPGGQNPQQRGLQLDMWGRGVGPDPHDEAILDALAPRPGDTLLTETGRDQIAEILDVPPETIGEQDNLLDHGLDSIRMMSFVETLRARGLAADFVELAEQPTLAHWRRLTAEQ